MSFTYCENLKPHTFSHAVSCSICFFFYHRHASLREVCWLWYHRPLCPKPPRHMDCDCRGLRLRTGWTKLFIAEGFTHWRILFPKIFTAAKYWATGYLLNISLTNIVVEKKNLWLSNQWPDEGGLWGVFRYNYQNFEIQTPICFGRLHIWHAQQFMG